jgi:cytochrome P450
MTEIDNRPLDGCPVAQDVEFLTGAVLDPFPELEALRNQGPVLYVSALDNYVVTRYQDVARVLVDQDGFSATNANTPLHPLCPEAQRVLKEGGFRRVPTLNSDPPRHGVIRKAVLGCLTPRRMNGMEPSVRKVAGDCINDLARYDIADLVEKVTFPMPGHVAFSLLGVPERDIPMVKAWCGPRVVLTYGDPSPEDQIRAAEVVAAFWRYIEDLVERRLSDPEDDLTSDLLAVHRESPETLSVSDVVNIVYALALASHDTSSNLMSNGIHQLLAHRDQWERLCADASLLPTAVDEALRFDGPVLAQRRRAVATTEIGGVQIPAGADVLLLFSSAHRDAQRFRDADVFDIARDDARFHLSFGKGSRMCLGATLARLEMRILLELLTNQLPDLALVPGEDPVFAPSIQSRSMRRLMVAPHGLTRTGQGARAPSVNGPI